MPQANTQLGRGQPLQPGRSISRRDYNNTRAAVRGATGVNGVRVELRRQGMIIDGAGLKASGFSLATFDFGWAGVDGTKALINGGFVLGFLGVVIAEDAEVNVGGNDANPHMIIAEGTVGTLTASIRSVSIPVGEFTGHSGDHWAWPLYKVCLRNGSPKRLRVHHVGAINLKSWVGG